MAEEEITKERVISYCQEKFLAEGFARISVDEITSDLAMSKKTFYKHFTSKEDVVQQIMERIMGNIRGNVERILLEDKSALEKFTEIVSMLGTNINRLAPLFAADIKKKMPVFWKHIEEFRRQRIADVFNRLLNQGVSEGIIRPDLNKRIFMMSLLSTIDGIVQPNILANESFSVSDAMKEIMRIFFAGALTEHGRVQFERVKK